MTWSPPDPKDRPSPKAGRRKQLYPPSTSGAPPLGKRPRTESPSSRAPGAPASPPAEAPALAEGAPPEDSIAEDEDSIAEEPSEVAIKAEPPASKEGAEGGSPLAKSLALAKSLVKASGESSSRDDSDDFGPGYPYTDDPGYDPDVGAFTSTGFPSFPFPVATEQEQVRNRRQLILQFITANKGRLSDTYVCLICNKQVTDNSNMNKHLEFKHGTELKLFLQSLAL